MVKGTLTLKIYRSLVAFLFTEFILYSSILFRMFIYYLNKILQEKNDTICRELKGVVILTLQHLFWLKV